MSKGAQALGVKCATSDLALVCSNGVVPNIPICSGTWEIMCYTMVAPRIEAKKFGVYSFLLMLMNPTNP